MSATKGLVALTVAVSTCGSPSSEPDPTPTVPIYSCESAFDTDCRYQADVDLTSGTLAAASIQPIPGGARSEGSFEALTGTVTVTDTEGIHAAITCDFTVDLDFVSERADGEALVEVVGQPTFDVACPLTCGWFLPGSGTYDATDGHFGIKWFEGQWELQFGASDPDEPEYGPLWMWSQTGSVVFDEGVTLDGSIAMGGGSWSVPMALGATHSPDATCVP